MAKAKKPAAKPAVSQKNTTKVKSAPPKTTPAKSTKTESSKATKTTAAVKSKTDTPAKASEPAKAAKPAKATKVVAAAVEPAKVVKAAEPVKAAKASAKADKPKVNAASSSAKVSRGPVDTAPEIVIKQAYNPAKLPPFVKKQQQRLIELRSALLDTLDGVTKDAIRTRPEGGDSGVGGMHMGDAGSDSYDRDFALSMLAKEQDALYEINEALKRIDGGVYGICEMSANKIHEERLEALPYTRYTREMQEQIERDQIGGKFRRPVVRSVFGLDDASEEDDEDGDDDTTSNSTPNNDSSLDFGKD
ncbi:TraR/DksA family transcriptional regulator [Phragmitibacter flavus]|uniref:TraR/DksA family transcriptional regulator n=1 Tax=Phragmitibacter flavus TaxID=2576071 RepID=UPI00140DB2E9|nr:hypothetical protein [Phragmitibacter flavus]